MKMSTYKKWMLESYLYEADDDKIWDEPIGKTDDGKPITVKTAYDNPNHALHKKAKAMVDKSKAKGDKDKGTKPDTTDQDSKAKEKGEEPSGEEPSGEEPSGEEPSGEEPKKGVFDKPGSGKADDYLGGDDEPEDKDSEFGKDYTSKFTGTDEPSGEEPSAEIPKPKREPVKVNYDGKSGEKGSTGKGATGRWAAWHGYSGKSAGFDSAEAAAAWASGAYDDPEDAIKVGKAAEEKRIAASKKEKEAAESAAAIKKEVENAPPEVKSWYEKSIGSKVDKALTYAEDVADWWENSDYGEDNTFPKWGETETRASYPESVEINGKKYRAIKESKKHPLKEQYDRLFKNKTVI